MIKLLVITGIIFFSIQLTYAQDYNQKLINNQNGEEILIGLCTRSVFQEKNYKEWYDEEYRYYIWSKNIHLLDSIKAKPDSLTILVVLGSWCEDSRKQFPRFMGLLDYIGFKDKNLKIICVDRTKKVIIGNIDSLKITLVPTFIFYHGKQEIGRIVESPVESLEADMYKIIRWRKDIDRK